MATYVISQITLPNGDVCQLKDANPVAELPSVTGSDNGKALMVVNGEWAVDDIPVEEIPIELPTVSSSDNGKVLTVVSGEWAAATTSGGNDNISINLNMTGNNANWSKLYEKLSAIPTNYVGVYRSIADCSNVLTGSKVNALMFGTVAHLTDVIFEFIARQANNANLYMWRITYVPEPNPMGDPIYNTATVGTVYKISGTAI